MIAEADIESIVKPLLNGMSFLLVEMSMSHHRGNSKVNLVLYKPGGITLDDLEKAQKVLRPRLELEYPKDTLSLEISSPGVYRRIKRNHEYAIFQGQSVKLLIGDDWMHGTIISADDRSIKLETRDGLKTIEFVDIRKGKLDV